MKEDGYRDSNRISTTCDRTLHPESDLRLQHLSRQLLPLILSGAVKVQANEQPRIVR